MRRIEFIYRDLDTLTPHTPMSTPHCDNCATDLQPIFALPARVFTDHVEVCSIVCLRAIRTKWIPSKKKVNRGFMPFVSGLFSSGVN